MEGGVRTVGPPGGQRATDTGGPPPPPPQREQQPTAYASSRMLSSSVVSASSAGSGASPVHRPVETPQSYSKSLLSSVQAVSTPSTRSAASPLSPPRPGPGAPPTSYPPFAGREAPPARFLQQQPHHPQQQTTHYGSNSAQVPYRENPYARMSQQQNDYGGPGMANSNGGGPNVSSGGGLLSVVDTTTIGKAGNNSHKYNISSSISSSSGSSINLPPPGSTIAGLVGQQQQQQQQHKAVVIESSSGPPPVSGPMRNRLSLLPHPPTQQQHAMEYEYSRQHPPMHNYPFLPDVVLSMRSGMDLIGGGPPMTKKIRLTSIEDDMQKQHQQLHRSIPGVSGLIMSKASPPPPMQLNVDTREQQQLPTMSSGAYNPQVEAISPTLPPDPQDEWRAMKDELLQKIAKVDIDIQKVEKQIMNLKNEEASLKEASARPPAAEESMEIPPKHRSLAQIIYAENRRKACLAHGVLLPLGPLVDLPLYNQPSDTDVCQAVLVRHEKFKMRLLRHFQFLKVSRLQRSAAFAESYAQKSLEWQRRVEKTESTAKRKAKEAKNREFFEKVFPELRKQREDKERFNRVGSRVKSEADLEEIMDGLQEQALEDKKMRSYAVIPPLMLDSEQKRYPFMNENGLLTDIVTESKDREHLNVWTAGEKEIFKEKYLQHPKNFCAIAVNLDRKSVADCVKFYYLSKKAENYKQMLRKARQRTRSSRNPQKSVPAQAPCIVDAMTTGVTTRLQREQQQKTGGRDRAANSASNNTNNNSGSNINSNSSNVATPATNSAPCGGAIGSNGGGVSPSTHAASPASSLNSNNSNTSSNTSNSFISNPNNIMLSSNSSSTLINNGIGGTKASSTYLRNEMANPTGSAVSSKNTATNAVNNINSSNSSAPSLPSFSVPAATSSSSSSCPGGGGGPLSMESSESTADGVTAVSTSLANVMTNTSTVGGCTSGDTNKTEAPIMSTNNNYGGNPSQQLPTNCNVDHKPSLNHCDIEIVDRDTNNATDGGIRSKALGEKSPSTSMLGVSDMLSIASWAKSKNDSVKMIGGNLPDGFQGVADAVKKDDASDRVCAVCKTKNGPMIYLQKGRGQIIGILEDAFLSDSYACHDCELDMRTWRPSASLATRNYPMCPLPTCVNMARRKRFRSIPSRLFDLAADIRDPVLREFRVPDGTRECCEMCVMKIRKRIKKHFKPTVLTESELASMKAVLSKWGPDWQRLEKLIGKPAKMLRLYFIDNKKTKKLANIVETYYAANPQALAQSLTDGENTDWSSSDEEPEGASDTASAESPNNPTGGSTGSSSSLSILQQPKGDILGMPPNNHHKVVVVSGPEEDRLMPPHGYMPKKHKISEECDSSATETADEENESSPANRHSPKGHLQFGSQTTITMVPSHLGVGQQQQYQVSAMNGPIRDSPRNVQDVISDVIERGLKGPSLVPPIMKGAGNVMGMGGIKTATDRLGNDRGGGIGTRLNESMKSRVLNHHENNLATLSVVNSQQQQQQSSHGVLGTHGHLQDGGGPTGKLLTQHGLQNQIAATITPLPLGAGIDQQQQHKGDNITTVRLPESEPQTLDLSIKKRDSSNVFPPPKSIHNSTTIYRNDNVNQPMYVPQSGLPSHTAPDTFSNFRTTKSPINIPMQSRRPPPPQQQQSHHSQFIMQQHHQQQLQQQMQHQQQMKQPTKGNPKGGGGNAGGPKSVGSITHGTPLNSLSGGQSGMLIQASGGGTSLSPRVENMMRQTPPETSSVGNIVNKVGSITQGTPLHMGTMHLQQGDPSGKQLAQHPPLVRSPYEGNGGNNNRQGPTYQQGPPGHPSGSVYARSPGVPYGSGGSGPGSGNVVGGHEAQQWSSRQILTNDYMTSQQMHRGGNVPQMTQMVGRGDKDSASPRSIMLSSTGGPLQSPQGGGYYEKDQRSASRENMMSRSSPAAEMRTPPPPQRQGVIQRHNTIGPIGSQQQPQGPQSGSMSKSPSPAANRIHVMSHYPPPGHEALSSLVDVAVQQPLLPVPHKGDDKGRTPTPTTEQLIALQQMRQMEMQRRPGGIPPSQHMYLRDQQMKLDHHREMEHKHREAREREHIIAVAAEREREQRERDRQERERSIMAERDRNMQAAERDRERLSTAMYDEHEERRRYGNPSQPPFGRDRPLMPPMRGDGESLTAAILIDAIITHQITQSNVDSSLPGRELHRPNYYSMRDPPHGFPMLNSSSSVSAANNPPPTTVEGNNGKSQSPNVIKIDLDSDSSSGAIMPMANRGVVSQGGTVKNITIGQITDSVISKDFASNSMISFRPPYGGAFHSDQQQQQPPVSMGAPEWMRRLPAGGQSKTDGMKELGRVPTPDDRQIIRMAQTPSPRAKTNVPIHEPVSPPPSEDNSGAAQPPHPGQYYGASISLQPLPGRSGSGSSPIPVTGSNSVGPPTSSHQTNFVLDCYVKNRIVEEMRIQEKSGGGGSAAGAGGDKGSGDRSGTPAGEEEILGSNRSSGSGAPLIGSPYGGVSTTVAYPFSAWNVSGGGGGGGQPQGNHLTGQQKPETGTGGVAPPTEPKPLLSAQYEELSDEDDNQDGRN